MTAVGRTSVYNFDEITELQMEINGNYGGEKGEHDPHLYVIRES